MRYLMAAAVLAVAFASPSFAAAPKHAGPVPNYDNCFRLSVFRGTDAYMDEQQDFIHQCMEGKIGFGDDFPLNSMRLPRDQENRQ